MKQPFKEPFRKPFIYGFFQQPQRNTTTQRNNNVTFNATQQQLQLRRSKRLNDACVIREPHVTVTGLRRKAAR